MEAAFCSAVRVTFFGINHAGLDEVFVFAGGDVVTFVAFAAFDFLHDDRAFDAGVGGEGAERAIRWRA